VGWVRGHGNDQGNILADGVATAAARVATVPFKVDLSAQDELRLLARCAGSVIEIDVRQFMNQQTTIQRHQTWLAQKRTKRAVRQVDEVDWRSTLAIVHNNQRTFFSSVSDTHQRTHGQRY
ncbi:hypothetical protein BGW38_008846, partial [Lunasporangiospora selenospora]